MKMKSLLSLAAAVLTVVTAGAQDRKADAADVGGTWNMTVKGTGSHGDMSATLRLTQTEGKVTGSMSAHGNEHALAGEISNGKLTLEATDMPADKTLTLTATLQDDGSLQGYLSGPMGDMRWSATRAKGIH